MSDLWFVSVKTLSAVTQQMSLQQPIVCVGLYSNYLGGGIILVSYLFSMSYLPVGKTRYFQCNSKNKILIILPTIICEILTA